MYLQRRGHFAAGHRRRYTRRLSAVSPLSPSAFPSPLVLPLHLYDSEYDSNEIVPPLLRATLLPNRELLPNNTDRQLGEARNQTPITTLGFWNRATADGSGIFASSPDDPGRNLVAQPEFLVFEIGGVIGDSGRNPIASMETGYILTPASSVLSMNASLDTVSATVPFFSKTISTRPTSSQSIIASSSTSSSHSTSSSSMLSSVPPSAQPSVSSTSSRDYIFARPVSFYVGLASLVILASFLLGAITMFFCLRKNSHRYSKSQLVLPRNPSQEPSLEPGPIFLIEESKATSSNSPISLLEQSDDQNYCIVDENHASTYPDAHTATDPRNQDCVLEATPTIPPKAAVLIRKATSFACEAPLLSPAWAQTSFKITNLSLSPLHKGSDGRTPEPFVRRAEQLESVVDWTYPSACDTSVTPYTVPQMSLPVFSKPEFKQSSESLLSTSSLAGGRLGELRVINRVLGDVSSNEEEHSTFRNTYVNSRHTQLDLTLASTPSDLDGCAIPEPSNVERMNDSAILSFQALGTPREQGTPMPRFMSMNLDEGGLHVPWHHSGSSPQRLKQPSASVSQVSKNDSKSPADMSSPSYNSSYDRHPRIIDTLRDGLHNALNVVATYTGSLNAPASNVEVNDRNTSIPKKVHKSLRKSSLRRVARSNLGENTMKTGFHTSRTKISSRKPSARLKPMSEIERIPSLIVSKAKDTKHPVLEAEISQDAHSERPLPMRTAVPTSNREDMANTSAKAPGLCMKQSHTLAPVLLADIPITCSDSRSSTKITRYHPINKGSITPAYAL